MLECILFLETYSALTLSVIKMPFLETFEISLLEVIKDFAFPESSIPFARADLIVLLEIETAEAL